MKKNIWKKALALVLCLTMTAALALMAAGCGNTDEPAQTTAPATEPAAEQTTEPVSTTEGASEAIVKGEGAVAFQLTVTDAEGNESLFEIHTDKKTVGEALVELGMVEGEDGEYGLYIKTVNGVTVDYDTDGKYWAFYVNGEYATKSVDQTEVTEGASYALKVE